MKTFIRSLAMAGTLLLASCSATPLLAASEFYHDRLLVSSVFSVYDGDTIKVNLDYMPSIIGTEISVRIRGVDTPELRGAKCDSEKALGYKARDYVRQQLLEAQTIELRKVGRDKYFRLLAEVWIDGESLGQLLLNEGLAYNYNGGTKQSWCTEKDVRS